MKSVVGESSNRRKLLGLSALSALVSFLFAWAAYSINAEARAAHRIIELLYPSAHLVALHGSDDVKGFLAELFLYIAKVLAVFVWCSAGVVLTFEFLGGEVRRLWILRPWRNPTVVYGSGPLAKQFVEEADQGKGDVLAVSQDDTELLEGAIVHQSSVIVAGSGNDYDNIAAALRVSALLEARPNPKRRHRTFVHIGSPELLSSLRQQRVFPAVPYHRVTVFSLFEERARLLLRESPLDFRTLDAASDLNVQLVIVGFGVMGEAILTRALMSGHYANLRPLRILVIDREAKKKERLLGNRYPSLSKIAYIEFLEADAREPESQARIAELCAFPQTLTTIAITFDGGLPMAMTLAGRMDRGVPILVRLEDGSEMAKRLAGPQPADFLSPGIKAFKAVRETPPKGKSWVDADLDAIAEAIHIDYVNELPPGDRDKRTARNWEDLDEDLVDSNRQAVDHIPVKLRSLGYQLVRKDDKRDGRPAPAFTDEQIESMAKMEHRRWMAERRLAGWTLGPKDTEKKISPYLVEWEALSDKVQEFDRNSVRNIPRFLDSRGWEIRLGLES